MISSRIKILVGIMMKIGMRQVSVTSVGRSPDTIDEMKARFRLNFRVLLHEKEETPMSLNPAHDISLLSGVDFFDTVRCT